MSADRLACGYRPDAIERYQAASPPVGIDNEMCINACALLDVYRPTALTPGELSRLQQPRLCNLKRLYELNNLGVSV